MSEMVERVALAISGSDDPANILHIHRSRARLAIAAMREPTGAMWDACGKAQADFETGIGWGVMIDAALSRC
jgi:hypothetical protein